MQWFRLDVEERKIRFRLKEARRLKSRMYNSRRICIKCQKEKLPINSEERVCPRCK